MAFSARSLSCWVSMRSRPATIRSMRTATRPTISPEASRKATSLALDTRLGDFERYLRVEDLHSDGIRFSPEDLGHVGRTAPFHVSVVHGHGHIGGHRPGQPGGLPSVHGEGPTDRE